VLIGEEYKIRFVALRGEKLFERKLDRAPFKREMGFPA
jgi:hypothetical protein